MQVKDEIDSCRYMVDKLQRNDHMDPVSHPITISERFQMMQEQKEFSSYNTALLETYTKLPSFKNTPYGMCLDGHRYLFRDNVPQSY